MNVKNYSIAIVLFLTSMSTLAMNGNKDPLSGSGKGTLFERIPKDLKKEISKYKEALDVEKIFKCPSLEELRAKKFNLPAEDYERGVHAEPYYRDKNDVLWDAFFNKGFNFDQPYKLNKVSINKNAKTGHNILCEYEFNGDIFKVGVNFRHSGFNFDRIGYDTTTFQTLSDGTIVSNDANIQFFVKKKSKLPERPKIPVKRTLFEGIPQELYQNISKYIDALYPEKIFKCPRVEELTANKDTLSYEELDYMANIASSKREHELYNYYKDENDVVWDIIYNKRFKFKNSYKLNKVIVNKNPSARHNILCEYELNGHIFKAGVDFRPSGFYFDQVSYDTNAFQTLSDGILVSDDVNIQFFVRKKS